MYKKRLVLAAISIAIAIGAILFFGFNNTGLVALLGARDTSTDNVTGAENKTNPENIITRAQGVSAGLSFEEVKPTTLDATISEGKIVSCPQTGEVTISVKNTGENTAERVKGFFRGFVVKECENCTAKQILPGEEISVKVTGCMESESAPFAQFWALNAEKKMVYFG